MAKIMKPSPNAMNISPAQKSLPFVIFISPSTAPAAYSATGFAARIAPRSTYLPVHVADELGAGLPQPLRQHHHQFHEDFRPENRVLQDDARQILPRQRREQTGLRRDAACKTRLAVDHRHLAERLARGDQRNQPRRVPAVLLEHFDSAFDQQDQEIARLALADDFGSRLGAINLHEMAQEPDLREIEVLE